MNGFQVTVVPLTLVIVIATGTRLELTVPVPTATQNVVLLQVICTMVLIVMPLWVKAVQVVPGDEDPVFEKIVDPLEVVPVTKQSGCAVELGHTRLVSAVVEGMVSFVQVAVDPEIVAVRSTPVDVVLSPIAMHAGVVALFGQSISVSCETPAGSVLLVQVVPFVDTAAAPPDEL